LSNMIKSSQYVPLDSSKLIEASLLKFPSRSKERATSAEGAHASHQAADLEQAVRDKQLEEEIERILSQARSEAETILKQAEQEAERMAREKQQEWEDWRIAREWQFEEEMRQAVEEARERAYAEGWAKAEQEAQMKWQQYIEQAADILREAHNQKQRIIAEAEPFLLDLSVQIAEKIIGHQLSLEKQWTIDLVKRVLARERRPGLVTLCVSPEQYMTIRDARDELMTMLDSQAELVIVPDSTVSGYGCVVRTDFGSLDARIDSQLSEIKQALRQFYASEHEGDNR